MNRIPTPLLLALGLALPAKAQLTHTLDSTIVTIDLVVDSDRVDIPWEILLGPDQGLWMTDRNRIIRWDPVSDVIDTMGVRPYGNGLGMAFHPLFPQVPQVFAVFDTSTYYAGGQLCEIVRFDHDPFLDTLINDTVLLAYPHFGEHSGGRLLFDGIGKLLCTTADYWPAFDTLGYRMGKVLRMNTDGSVPADNPTADHTWTRGHRNPQGLCALPNGNIIVSEHGMPSDELNLIVPGIDHGWPVWDGVGCTNILPDSCLSSTYITEDPLAIYFHPPSGIEHYPHAAIPEFTDKAITCVLWQQGLVTFGFNGTYDSVTVVERFDGGAFQDLGRIRDLAVHPDGSIYFITNDRQEARIRRMYRNIGTGMRDRATSSVALWPNPATDIVHLRADAPIGAIVLIDALGRPVPALVHRSGNAATLVTEGLARGAYVLRIQQDDGVLVERMLLQ